MDRGREGGKGRSRSKDRSRERRRGRGREKDRGKRSRSHPHHDEHEAWEALKAYIKKKGVSRKVLRGWCVDQTKEGLVYVSPEGGTYGSKAEVMKALQ
ncbi:unnamed protein product, partial [Chrysoparadoxa australica]